MFIGWTPWLTDQKQLEECFDPQTEHSSSTEYDLAGRDTYARPCHRDSPRLCAWRLTTRSFPGWTPRNIKLLVSPPAEPGDFQFLLRNLFPQLLLGTPLEQRYGTGLTNPIFKGPERRSVRNIQSLRQSAEMLIAQPIEQQEFYLPIRQITVASKPECAP